MYVRLVESPSFYNHFSKRMKSAHCYNFTPDLFVRVIFSDRAMHQHVTAMVSLRSLVFKESCIW